MKITRPKVLGAIGVLTLAAASSLGAIRTGIAPAGWAVAEPWVGLSAAVLGGLTTLAGAIFDGIQGRRKAERDEIDRLVNGLKWSMYNNDGISPFDSGFAVWVPLRSWWRKARRKSLRLTPKTYRSRSRNRHATTGVEWTVGKGVIGRCIETGDIIGEDLEDRWGRLRNCDEETWLKEPEVEVRQRLSYEEFRGIQGSGSVLMGGHLMYVLAVPILSRAGGERLGCVALDMPPAAVPAGIREGHYIVEGLRGIADVLGSAEG